MNFNKYKNIKKLYDVDLLNFVKKKNLKKLTINKKKSLGRSFGQIVTWHKGGGVKRKYRLLLNFSSLLNKFGIVRSIEYDPNRSSFIGVIQLQNGSFTQTIISSTLKVNDVITFSQNNSLTAKVGDSLKLRYALKGFSLHNLESYPGSGAVYAKAAGVNAVLLSKNSKYAKVRLSSGEERIFDLNCSAMLGVPSNLYRKFHKKYKAGTNRLLNIRPTVRGVAMNPIDHPHGGGAGKTGAKRPSVSPWGRLTKGVPTRKKNIFNKFIIKRK